MPKTLPQGFLKNFLGNAPEWYKLTILAFLIANPILLYTIGPFSTGWNLSLNLYLPWAWRGRCSLWPTTLPTVFCP